MQRRDFVRNLLGASAALAAGPALRSMTVPAANYRNHRRPPAAAFIAAAGSAFTVHGPTGAQQVVLKEVAHFHCVNTETISMLFVGRAPERLAGAAYPFVHPTLGRRNWLVVPGVVSGDTCRYRVTLSRFI